MNRSRRYDDAERADAVGTANRRGLMVAAPGRAANGDAGADGTAALANESPSSEGGFVVEWQVVSDPTDSASEAGVVATVVHGRTFSRRH